MRNKIAATVIIYFLPIIVFSQDKILLHSFKNHTNVDATKAGCYDGIPDQHNDYMIDLFSDSTFTLSYSYFYSSEFQEMRIGNKMEISGKFFSKEGKVYLHQNSICKDSILNLPGGQAISSTIASDVRIDFTTDNLTLYISPYHFLSFVKPNPFNIDKRAKKTKFLACK